MAWRYLQCSSAAMLRQGRVLLVVRQGKAQPLPLALTRTCTLHAPPPPALRSGVCWNKKNRRWQAAINSSGKYIYLGSFVQVSRLRGEAGLGRNGGSKLGGSCEMGLVRWTL